MYSHYVWKTPCFQCGGKVESASWDSDCRGNDGGGFLRCTRCGKSYGEEWQTILAYDELKQNQHDYWKDQYKSFGPYEFSPYHPDYDFSKVLEPDL